MLVVANINNFGAVVESHSARMNSGASGQLLVHDSQGTQLTTVYIESPQSRDV